MTAICEQGCHLPGTENHRDELLSGWETSGLTKRSQNLSRKKRLVFSFIVFLIPATFICAVYVVYTGYRSMPIYTFLKQHEPGWRGGIHRSDAELGYAPIPDTRGAEVFPDGSDVPARYDKDGFRVPLEDEGARINRRPMVLTLGCSFTYGAATNAENTYPYLTGQLLGGTTRNAGVCGYGLAQMIVLARRLVPTYQPDYLLVQYSSWLTDRAQTPFAASPLGKVPTPYLFLRQNQMELQPPVFQTRTMNLPTDTYRSTNEGVLDRVSFLWHVGLPLYLHDDFNMCYYDIRKLFGRVPEPVANPQQVNKYAYEEIAKVARENGAKLVIVILGYDETPVTIPKAAVPSEAIVVDAHKALLERLPVASNEAYQKAYYHWRGSPLRMVDAHPNENAHRIIAEAIVQKLKGAGVANPGNRLQTGPN